MAKNKPSYEPQPSPKRFTQLDGMVTNAINFDNPMFTLGRGRRECHVTFSNNKMTKAEHVIVPPSQAKQPFGDGIYRAYDKPSGRGRR